MVWSSFGQWSRHQYHRGNLSRCPLCPHGCQRIFGLDPYRKLSRQGRCLPIGNDKQNHLYCWWRRTPVGEEKSKDVCSAFGLADSHFQNLLSKHLWPCPKKQKRCFCHPNAKHNQYQCPRAVVAHEQSPFFFRVLCGFGMECSSGL